MSTIYSLFFLLILINNLNASSWNSENVSVKYTNDFVPRVVNGWPANLGDVPYQIALKRKVRRTRIYYTFCGGTIISPVKLLSAAHCFAKDEKNICKSLCGGAAKKVSLLNVMAVAGNLRNRGYQSLVDSATEGQWRSLSRVVFPRTYKFPKDDIALVWTVRPFVYTATIGPIPIARRHIDYSGKCLVSGYGRISRYQTSDRLLLAYLELIPQRRCNKIFRKKMDRFVCTTPTVTDVERGDSGGPLVCSDTRDPNEVGGKGILVGIVSGSKPRVVSFFVRVSSYYGYIMRDKCSRLALDVNMLFVLYFLLVINNLLLF